MILYRQLKVCQALSWDCNFVRYFCLVLVGLFVVFFLIKDGSCWNTAVVCVRPVYSLRSMEVYSGDRLILVPAFMFWLSDVSAELLGAVSYLTSSNPQNFSVFKCSIFLIPVKKAYWLLIWIGVCNCRCYQSFEERNTSTLRYWSRPSNMEQMTCLLGQFMQEQALSFSWASGKG